MDPSRFIGPPLMAMVFSSTVLVAATAGLVAYPGPASIAFAAVAALVVWRLFRLAVYFDGSELVVRNTLRTYRFPVTGVDIRARVVDPRVEYYSSGDSAGHPGIPAAADDNTPQAAKWYELVHGDDRYQIDALMGRTPTHHERLAWELRKQILAARDAAPGTG